MDASARSAKTAHNIKPNAVAREYVSWGRYPRMQHRATYRPSWSDEVPAILRQAQDASLVPFGVGRSYGDCSLNEGRDILDCSRLNRILAFDRESGRIWCEAGATLADILEIAVPAGWFLPVTSGTKFVTIGGAIANDIHGKNHHGAGSFGNHVTRLKLYRSDYGLLECSVRENAEMFGATVAGLGLTGVILSAEIQLKAIPGDRIAEEKIPFHSLGEFLSIANDSDAAFEYTVAWIDCFSGARPRGIFFRGNHAESRDESPRIEGGPAVPFALPEWALNRYSVTAFNSAYYRWNSLRRGKNIVHYDPFFYPLDSILNWNLIYGRRGFLQHQCVVPDSAGGALERMLLLVKRSGLGSFLAVLKRFGESRSPGIMSFPRPGLTLALDFPMRGERTLQLLQSLDDVVLEAGGAVYPAKDARMSPTLFQAGFPRSREFRRYIDPKLSSSFWRRVTGE